MARRLLWPVVLLLSGAGVLVAHDLAYRLTGAGAAGLHGYLAHAPQVLVALSLPAALVAISGGRAAPPKPSAFALLGVASFTALEHLERLGEGGVPWLLSTPVFLLGLVLQLPFALAAWWLARSVLALDPPAAAVPPRLSGATCALAQPVRSLVAVLAPPRARLRAPPALL
jgi:hypothetical protein